MHPFRIEYPIYKYDRTLVEPEEDENHLPYIEENWWFEFPNKVVVEIRYYSSDYWDVDFFETPGIVGKCLTMKNLNEVISFLEKVIRL